MASVKPIPSERRESAVGGLLGQCLGALNVNKATWKHKESPKVFFMECNDSGVRLIDSEDESPASDASEGYLSVEGDSEASTLTKRSG